MKEKKESLLEKLQRKDEREKKLWKKNLRRMTLGLGLMALLFFFFWPILSLHYYKNLYRKGKPAEKERALNKLTALDNPKALGTFLSAMVDAPEAKRAQLGPIIHQWVSPATLPVLIERLQSSSSRKQISVLVTLPYLRDLSFLKKEQSLWKPVKALAYSADVSVRREALRTLSHFPSHAKLVYFIDGLHNLPNGLDFLALILNRVSVNQMPLLLQKLASPQSIDRKNAGLVISQMVDRGKFFFDWPKLKALLLPCLKDPDNLVRFYAMLIYQKGATVEDLPNLVQLARDKDEDLRQMLAVLLGRLKKGKDVLLQLRNDSSRIVREEALLSLGKIGEKSVIPLLIQVVKDKKSTKRLEAIALLGHLKALEVIGLLRNILDDQGGQYHSLPLRGASREGENFKIYAARALGDLGSKKALGHLLTYLIYPFSPKVRKVCLQEALKIETRKNLLPLLVEKFSQSESPTERKYLKKAILTLKKIPPEKKYTQHE